MSAHFQVIPVARPLTSSSVTSRVIADAALVGAEDVVVLDAVAFEELVAAVVHPDGEVDDELVFGLREDGRHLARQVHRLGRFFELGLDDGVEVALLLQGRVRRADGRRTVLRWGSFCAMVVLLSSRSRERQMNLPLETRRTASPIAVAGRDGKIRTPRVEIFNRSARDWARAPRACSRAFRGARELQSVSAASSAEAVYGLSAGAGAWLRRRARDATPLALYLVGSRRVSRRRAGRDRAARARDRSGARSRRRRVQPRRGSPTRTSGWRSRSPIRRGW